MHAGTLSSWCLMVILSASEVGDAVPTCFPCYVEVPVLGGNPVPGGCLVQLLGACKREPASGEGAPAKVPSVPGAECLWAVLLCMATWEAIPHSKEVPTTKFHHQNLPAPTYRLMLRAAACEVKSL